MRGLWLPVFGSIQQAPLFLCPERNLHMTRYFAKDTPLAGLERMMMSVPGFQHRGSGVRILNRFRYRAEDLNCRYCLHYQRKGCIIPVCPYIAERLEAVRLGTGNW